MLFALAPILTPTIPSFRFLAFFDTYNIPLLLKPILLIKASSSGSLNNRGLGLPVCGFGVIVPTSTKPKPKDRVALKTSAFLSKPAANPMGEANSIPHIFVFKPVAAFFFF